MTRRVLHSPMSSIETKFGGLLAFRDSNSGGGYHVPCRRTHTVAQVEPRAFRPLEHLYEAL